MGDLSMNRAEREAFLADVRIGVLAVEQADGPPLVSPLWYRYEPGGAIEFTTESTTQKVGLLRVCGRATLLVQREEFPPAYVSVEGSVSMGPASEEVRLEIATRYLGADGAREYLQASRDDLAVILEPQRWRTVDYAKLPGSA